MNRSLVPGSLVLLLALQSAGCAFGTRRPVLNYTVGSQQKPARNINLYVEQFSDERLDRNVIGHVRNGWGMKTAEVVTVTNIADWVTEAMRAELKNSGYTLTDDVNTEHAIQGEVIKVYCDSFMSYDGEVGVEVTLRKGAQDLFRKKYLGKDSSINMASTAKSYGITMERSLQKALVDAVHDIDRSLSEKLAKKQD